MTFEPSRAPRLLQALALSLSAACLSACMMGRPYSIAMVKPAAQTLFVVGEADATGAASQTDSPAPAPASSALVSNTGMTLSDASDHDLITGSQSAVTAIRKATATAAGTGGTLQDAIAISNPAGQVSTPAIALQVTAPVTSTPLSPSAVSLTVPLGPAPTPAVAVQVVAPVTSPLSSPSAVSLNASTSAVAVQVVAPITSPLSSPSAVSLTASAPLASTTASIAGAPTALAAVASAGNGGGVGVQASLTGLTAAATLSAPSLTGALGALTPQKALFRKSH